ncbi:glycosyltransferase family 2 protein [Conservatibacter flavescens]|uniref:Glycosyltransferase family 2 protein n=1 Tax=Conservatibacter flavescens TaxID=28161 RepID=A0A2M8RZW6_9PAST|nr:glycosyltransferase family 2 protein [Conservatibacter flavescens]PJG84406.1 glycosyltransferase family 2 protein [Conservatibacter flavescens]
MKKLNYDVILCTYNGSKYVQQQLESILKQNILPKKIIISDDFSKDNTLELIENIFLSYSFSCYEIVSGLQKGAKYNFLSALKYAKEDYTFFSDQDDIWHPNKIGIFSQYLQSTKTALLVFSDSRIINNKNYVISDSFFDYQGLTARVFEDDSILFKNCVQGAASCVNRSMRELVLKSLDLVDWDHLYMHDWWIALLAKYYGEAIFIPQPLIDYRQHSNNQIGAFDRKKRWLVYFTNLSVFIHNFRLAILQKKSLDSFDLLVCGNLPKNKFRQYKFVSKLKRILIRLMSL